MEKRKIIWIVIATLLFGGLIFAGCGSAPTATPTSHETEPEATEAPANPTDLPLQLPTEVEVVDECVNCHSEQDQLV
ncbi:MAG TPA: hypothetical protein VJ965_09425, partial [Anaerolineales bacterium]|nr:hypothetical protein [Anaerolineales bacterium]